MEEGWEDRGVGSHVRKGLEELNACVQEMVQEADKSLQTLARQSWSANREEGTGKEWLFLWLVAVLLPLASIIGGALAINSGSALGIGAGTILLVAGLALWAAAVGMTKGRLFQPIRRAFDASQTKAHEVLELINNEIGHERSRLAQDEQADILTVESLPSTEGSTVCQAVPLWWRLAAPLRLACFLVGGLVLWLPDTFVVFYHDAADGEGSNESNEKKGDEEEEDAADERERWQREVWEKEPLLGLFYRAVVRPWVVLLVGSSMAVSYRVAPSLDKALARLADGTEGVTFVQTGPKKRPRALVKIRDDYLAPLLFHRSLDARSWCCWTMLCHDPCIAVCPGALLLGLWWIVVTALLRPLRYFALAGRQTLRVVDIARGSLVCDSAAHMVAVHNLLMQGALKLPNDSGEGGESAFEVVRFKNGWADAPSGYVQLLYNVRLNGGPVCEVQVTHADIFKWRKYTHKPYKIVRADNAFALVQDLKGQGQSRLGQAAAQLREKLGQALAKPSRTTPEGE